MFIVVIMFFVLLSRQLLVSFLLKVFVLVLLGSLLSYVSSLLVLRVLEIVVLGIRNFIVELVSVELFLNYQVEFLIFNGLLGFLWQIGSMLLILCLILFIVCVSLLFIFLLLMRLKVVVVFLMMLGIVLSVNFLSVLLNLLSGFCLWVW